MIVKDWKGRKMKINVMTPRGTGTIIYVDFGEETVRIENKTSEIMDTAFGINLEPTWDDFKAFLEERCFPRTRDKMKLVLRDVGVPFYEPLTIIEKTQGRMAEDDMWLEIDWEKEEEYENDR